MNTNAIHLFLRLPIVFGALSDRYDSRRLFGLFGRLLDVSAEKSSDLASEACKRLRRPWRPRWC